MQIPSRDLIIAFTRQQQQQQQQQLTTAKQRRVRRAAGIGIGSRIMQYAMPLSLYIIQRRNFDRQKAMEMTACVCVCMCVCVACCLVLGVMLRLSLTLVCRFDNLLSWMFYSI